MSPTSPYPAIAALLLATLTCLFIAKQYGAPPSQGRYASIDGLRGYLAFFVFLHHASVWYFYLRSGQWSVPPSRLYTHFGQSSVTLFFMITGFLFFSKIIDGRQKSIDWPKLYVSRFLRLVPLYAIALLMVFSLVAMLSKGELTEPVLKICNEAMHWLTFTMFGSPDINGVKHTSSIVAGVTWSLPYEWFFYFSLPMLAWVMRTPVPRRFIVMSVASFAVLLKWHPGASQLLAFTGGIAASGLVRWDVFRRWASSSLASLVVLSSASAAVMAFSTAYSTAPVILLSLAFSLIAGGNGLFGTLFSPLSRTLGEMAYSIYLLHGVVLFLTFECLLGSHYARELSPLAHWAIVMAITPFLLGICFVTFRFIEQPAMHSTDKVTQWIRRLGRNSHD